MGHSSSIIYYLAAPNKSEGGSNGVGGNWRGADDVTVAVRDRGTMQESKCLAYDSRNNKHANLAHSYLPERRKVTREKEKRRKREKEKKRKGKGKNTYTFAPT